MGQGPYGPMGWTMWPAHGLAQEANQAVVPLPFHPTVLADGMPCPRAAPQRHRLHGRGAVKCHESIGGCGHRYGRIATPRQLARDGSLVTEMCGQGGYSSHMSLALDRHRTSLPIQGGQ